MALEQERVPMQPGAADAKQSNADATAENQTPSRGRTGRRHELGG